MILENSIDYKPLYDNGQRAAENSLVTVLRRELTRSYTHPVSKLYTDYFLGLSLYCKRLGVSTHQFTAILNLTKYRSLYSSSIVVINQ